MKKNNQNNNGSEIKSILNFAKDYVFGVIKEINPWNNFKIMHTNVLGDLMAGLTVAIIALPLALAFGVASGLGAISGVWGAICGGIFGGGFGGCRVGVSGPTGPKVVQLAAIMVAFRLADGTPDVSAAFTMVFLSGVILLVISLLRVSNLIYYTPYSVVSGFMCGIGLIVMLLEFDSFLGLPPEHSVIAAIKDIPYAITHTNPQALAVSIPTLLILFLWPYAGRLWKKLKLIPAPMLGLLVGTGIAQIFSLNIEYIGNIPTGLPKIYFPDLSRFNEFFLPSLSLAGLAIFDSLLTCMVADNIIKVRHSSDRESFGQGLGNMAAGLLGGVTCATATMRTIANVQAGGKTPLAAVFHGVVLLALVLGLGPLASGIPMACLAAILFKVGIDILDYRILPVVHRLPLTDALVFWTVFIVTVGVDLLMAMGIGVALAFARFVIEVSKTYKPNVYYNKRAALNIKLADNLCKNEDVLCVIEPHGPLFFGSVEAIGDAYQHSKKHDGLVIDLKHVTMVDISGAFVLEDVINNAKEKESKVFVVNASKQVSKILNKVTRVKNKAHVFSGYVEDMVHQAEDLGVTNKTS